MGFFFLHWRIPRKRKHFFGRTQFLMGFLGLGRRAHPKTPKNFWNERRFFPPLLFLLFPTQDFSNSIWKLLFPNFLLFPCSKIFICPWETSGVIPHLGILEGLEKNTDFFQILGNSGKTTRNYGIKTPIPAGFVPCPPQRCFVR